LSRTPEALAGLIDAAGEHSLAAVAQWLLAASETERIAANPTVRQLLKDRAVPCRPLRLAGVGTAAPPAHAVGARAARWDAAPQPLGRVCGF
jgi:hypothetical protein